MIRLVSATGFDQVLFERHALLARTLENLKSVKAIKPEILFNNSKGLPEVYNAALAKCDNGDIVVFVHHDVWIGDQSLAQQLEAGLSTFDVIGVAGNQRRVLGQTAWHLVEGNWDTPNLSGAVAHLNGFTEVTRQYGKSGTSVQLLDGVLLAAKVSRLRAAAILFDPQFDFHLYDLDFCRTCAKAGLSMGTWPIEITHTGRGEYGSPSWIKNAEKYLVKWGG